MKKLISVLMVAAVLLAVAGPSFAERPSWVPSDWKLRKVGTVQTGDATIARGGHDIAMIAVTCTGTACTATLADPVDDPRVAGDYGADSVVVIEVGAPASQTTVLDLTESPINFANGIELNDDNNVAAVSVFEWAP